MLIIPPAPTRWSALEDLLGHKGPPWITDIRQRVQAGVPGAQDAWAVMPVGGQFVAAACINKCAAVGVFGHCFTRPEHRRRGYARQVVETAVSWFDMTGGRWLFLGTTAELDEGLYRKFGFVPLRRLPWQPHDRLTMIRTRPGTSEDLFAESTDDDKVVVRDLTRAHWAAMVALLQFRPGPDPRVSLEESAVTAELFTLDLIDHQERGACQLKGAFDRDGRLVALATIATDRAGGRTHAMLIPHDGAPGALRAAVYELALERGFAHVDFPMAALRPVPDAAAPAARRPGVPADVSGPAAVDVPPGGDS